MASQPEHIDAEIAERTRTLAVYLEEQARRLKREELQDDFPAFVRWCWHILEPGRQLRWNWSIEIVCRFLADFAFRKFRRGIINIPPRNMKSILVSVCYPVWVWIQDQDRLRREKRPGWEFVGSWHQFLCLSNGDDLALRDALQTRNLIEHPDFLELFGDLVEIPDGQNEKGYYRTQANGHRISRSITSRIIGRGADTELIDDPHDAQKAQSDATRTQVLDAYSGGVTSRLNDQANGGILIIMQRVHGADLVDFVVKKDGLWADDNPGGWMKLVLPMEFELSSDGEEINPAGVHGYFDPRTEPGELLWPGRFPADAVESLKSDLESNSGLYGASCQLQQRPSPADGGILKKKWWRMWPDDKPLPICEHVFLSWDTAYTEAEMKRAAYSARTAWGVFWDEQAQAHSIILLHGWAGRVGYPDLRKKAQDDTVDFLPDCHLIEKKASGISLVQDLRRAGRRGRKVRLRTYMPDRDKVARAHAASSPLSSGRIWAPNRRWADTVINACAVFPNGAPPSADYTDTVTQAILYLTRGWWVEHPDDEDEDSYLGGDAYKDEDDEGNPKHGGVYG